MYISDNIKFLRKKNNLTQKQLSEKCGIPIITLQQYERGVRKQPRAEILSRLSEALNVPISYLLSESCWREPFRKWLKETISKLEDKYGQDMSQYNDWKKMKYMAEDKIYYTYDDAQAVAHSLEGTSIEEIVEQFGNEVTYKALEYHPFEVIEDLDIADNMLIKSVHEICGLNYVKDVTMKDIKKIELVQNFIQDNEKTLKKMMEILDK